MTWVLNNAGLIGELTLSHIWLSLVPIVIGALLSLPIGWLAHRFAIIRAPLLGAVGVLYTVPSLALFVLLPPLIGIPILSDANVIIALAVYAVSIMVRSVADAFASIDPSALRAATAVGYGPWQRVFMVELPLAAPVLVAGLRVVAASTVSLVTVGVLVGVKSLGYLFTDGFQRRIHEEILIGIVMTLVVAALFDLALILGKRALMPWHESLRRSLQKTGE